MLTISLHRSGTERRMLRFRDVERGRDLRLSVEAVGPNAAWVSDERVLLSRVDATGRPVSIHRFDLEAGLGPSIFARPARERVAFDRSAGGWHARGGVGRRPLARGAGDHDGVDFFDVPNGSEPAGMSYCGARRQLVVHMLEDDSTESLHVALIADGGPAAGGGPPRRAHRDDRKHHGARRRHRRADAPARRAVDHVDRLRRSADRRSGSRTRTSRRRSRSTTPRHRPASSVHVEVVTPTAPARPLVRPCTARSSATSAHRT